MQSRQTSSPAWCAGVAHDFAPPPRAPAAQSSGQGLHPFAVAHARVPVAIVGPSVRPREAAGPCALAVAVLPDIGHALRLAVGPGPVTSAVRPFADVQGAVRPNHPAVTVGARAPSLSPWCARCPLPHRMRLPPRAPMATMRSGATTTIETARLRARRRAGMGSRRFRGRIPRTATCETGMGMGLCASSRVRGLPFEVVRSVAGDLAPDGEEVMQLVVCLHVRRLDVRFTPPSDFLNGVPSLLTHPRWHSAPVCSLPLQSICERVRLLLRVAIARRCRTDQCP